jgi:hypothetical protein
VFPTDAVGEMHYVENRYHALGSYIDAFRGAGLDITACAEPTMDRSQTQRMPAHEAYPEANDAAFDGLPYILVWVATKG